MKNQSGSAEGSVVRIFQVGALEAGAKYTLNHFLPLAIGVDTVECDNFFRCRIIFEEGQSVDSGFPSTGDR